MCMNETVRKHFRILYHAGLCSARRVRGQIIARNAVFIPWKQQNSLAAESKDREIIVLVFGEQSMYTNDGTVLLQGLEIWL